MGPLKCTYLFTPGMPYCSRDCCNCKFTRSGKSTSDKNRLYADHIMTGPVNFNPNCSTKCKMYAFCCKTSYFAMQSNRRATLLFMREQNERLEKYLFEEG